MGESVFTELSYFFAGNKLFPEGRCVMKDWGTAGEPV